MACQLAHNQDACKSADQRRPVGVTEIQASSKTCISQIRTSQRSLHWIDNTSKSGVKRSRLRSKYLPEGFAGEARAPLHPMEPPPGPLPDLLLLKHLLEPSDRVTKRPERSSDDQATERATDSAIERAIERARA